MPIYEYACEKCQSEFEILLRGDDQPECPTCGNRHLEKQLSVPAAHSNGSRELPICSPSPVGCGKPQCGIGGCAMQ